MTEDEKLKKVSLEAKRLFEVATAGRKYNSDKKAFTFFSDIDADCFTHSKFNLVLIE